MTIMNIVAVDVDVDVDILALIQSKELKQKHDDDTRDKKWND